MTAINSKQALDFYTDEQVGFGNQIPSTCQQHHIFPDAKYKSNNHIASVFNFTYITSKSNQFIKDKRTNEYIPGIVTETQIPLARLKSKLSAHFIDDRCFNDLETQSFDDFLKNRAENIFNYLKNEIGINLTITSTQTEAQEVDIDANFESDESEN